MLSFSWLTAEEETKAAKGHLNINAAELIKQIFCKCLDFKIEVKWYVTLEKKFCFCFHRKWEALDLLRVKKNHLWPKETTWAISGRNRWPRCLSSSSRIGSRLLPEMIKTHRILQSGLDHNSKFSLHPRKIISAPNQLEVVWNTTLTFPKLDYGYFPLFFLF